MPTGRLKLVFKWVDFAKLLQQHRDALFARSHHRRFDDLLDEIEQQMRTCFEQYPGMVVYREDPQDLGRSEEEDDPRREYTMYLTHEDLYEVFPKLASVALDIIDRYKKDYGLFLNLDASIVVLSPEFFTDDFLPANEKMHAARVSFGNIIDFNTFAEHREIVPDISNLKVRIMTKYYGTPQGHTLLVDMEHDCRKMTVRFPYFINERDKQGQKRDVEAVVKLEVRYANIRRVLLDMVPAGDSYNVRLYFHISCPPTIRIVRLQNGGPKNGGSANFLARSGDRWRVWNKLQKNLHAEVNESPVLHIHFDSLKPEELSNILGRLNNCVGQVELRNFTKPLPYPHCNYVRSPLEDANCRAMLESRANTEEDREKDRYALTYMIEAFLSRGAVFKDYILAGTEVRDAFVKQVADHYFEDRILTMKVLECLLAQLDESPEPGHPKRLYDRIYRQQLHNADDLKELYNDFTKKGFVRIRKILVTPTRVLLVAPELLMGNRVLRLDPDGKWPTDRFLRVIFRDDTGGHVHPNMVSDRLIDFFIKDKLKNGIKIAGREFNFLGSSNSQLRDGGCYFLNASHEEIILFRKGLGSFKIQSIPKMMARLGQCFTQARETEAAFEREEYVDGYDYAGGKNSKNEPYTFSDGVGRMSRHLASRISKDLELKSCVPSCFQIRFRGYKGVLMVDPHLDAVSTWGVENGVTQTVNIKRNDAWLNVHLYFRPSQKKFDAARDKTLEIVKYSAPTSLCFNRPFINILDQVSEMQSKAVHARLCKRIHWLLDLTLHNMTRALIDEQRARNRLAEFPKLILYDLLTDINLTQEPFFRSLLRGAARASLQKLRQKLQIPIPTHLGRAMFGVVDETDELQRGQVFIQYTKNIGNKLPGPTAERVVHLGPVLITKNPCIVEGDVRMFEAVDVPALRNTCCDVLVFPRHGPRPHSDEMAGSDLDGDEYTVLWDTELFLVRNEKPFDFSGTQPEVKASGEEEFKAKMADFFVDYIKQDSVGRIANAFLVNSDLYGITSEVCKRIALKHMEAVDFPKTGIPPKALQTKWDGEVPPERSERMPDYMEKNHEPTYISQRLNGQLFRRVKVVDDILSLAAKQSETAAVELDPLLSVDGCIPEDILQQAEVHYNAYVANMQSLLDTYGIQSEGELFSGSYMTLKNRLSDKDSDDMSLYNTQHAIEQRLTASFASARRAFFEDVGARYPRTVMEDITIPVNRHIFSDVKDVFRRVCHDPPVRYKQLACAYYRTAYQSSGGKFLSFPWVAWDVLNIIRKDNMAQPDEETGETQHFSFHPIYDKLSQHIEQYLQGRMSRFRKLQNKICRWHELAGEDQTVYKTILRYVKRHLGLDELIFFCIRWGQKKKLYDGPLKEAHIALLLIMFALNRLPCESVEPVVVFLEQTDDELQDESQAMDLKKQTGGLGQKFLRFMEFLASRQFERLRCIRFAEVGCPGSFLNNEWDRLHVEAMDTYHRMVYTGRFDILPSTEAQLDAMSGLVNELPEIEDEPFVIEVPNKSTHLLRQAGIIQRLKERTGCAHIVFRIQPAFANSETRRVLVSMSGTITAISKLKRALAVTPHITPGTDCKTASKQLAGQVLEKLLA